MKKLIFAVAALLLVMKASAQTDSLSFDENNKYIYYQVVIQPNLKADTLYKRAVQFLKTAYDKDKLKLDKEDKAKGSVTGKGGFMVSRKALVSTHEDAKIAYKLHIEVKDGRYRFWLTDYVVILYQRNRYASFEPVSGKDVPLELGLKKLGQKDFDDFFNKTLLNSRAISNKLKAYMVSVPALQPKDNKVKTVNTKEW
ncbi:hypothetical protein GCM10023149_09650 [Mucilaginibacter gynuensis]|uniref:DUF4468 domain-containing protein n=1 Tax=Mucilaginibacter gynuensis TaxID=1302236 RepID=A0ABP8FYU6_9SPHI